MLTFGSCVVISGMLYYHRRRTIQRTTWIHRMLGQESLLKMLTSCLHAGGETFSHPWASRLEIKCKDARLLREISRAGFGSDTPHIEPYARNLRRTLHHTRWVVFVCIQPSFARERLILVDDSCIGYGFPYY